MSTPPEKVETTPAVADEAPAKGKQDITPQQLAIVGGVVLVIVLGLLYFFVLRGDGAEEVVPPPTAEGVPAPTEAPPTEAPDDDDDDDEIETFEVFAPRDPFEPLISAAGGGGGEAVDGGGTVDDGVSGDGGDGGVVDGNVDDPEPDGDNIGNHRVKVIDVYTQNGEGRAQVQVDGTVYTVDEGEGFAGNFRLVSTSGSCATILFGDDEFTLCEGEEILK